VPDGGRHRATRDGVGRDAGHSCQAGGEPSAMILDLEGWRFEYSVDVKARLIMVDAAVFRGK